MLRSFKKISEMENNWWKWETLLNWLFHMIYPVDMSIHFLYSFNPIQGHSGAGAYPSCLRARGGVHPGVVTQDTQPCNHKNNPPNMHVFAQWEEARVPNRFFLVISFL